jgi:hypothetical protein
MLIQLIPGADEPLDLLRRQCIADDEKTVVVEILALLRCECVEIHGDPVKIKQFYSAVRVRKS